MTHSPDMASAQPSSIRCHLNPQATSRGSLMSQPPMPSAPPTQPLPQLQPQPWPQQGMPPGGLQPPYAAVPVQQQPKKPKRFGSPTVIITAVAALSIIGIIR